MTDQNMPDFDEELRAAYIRSMTAVRTLPDERKAVPLLDLNLLAQRVSEHAHARGSGMTSRMSARTCA